MSFVEKQTRIICNPVYGNIDSTDDKPRNQSSSQNPKKTKRSNFATNVQGEEKAEQDKKPPSRWCVNCEKSTHNTDVCRVLQAKTYEDKKTFVQKAGLCYACLRRGHRAKDCKHRLKCNTCQRLHPTVLHREPAKTSATSAPAGNQATSASTTCGLTGAGYFTSVMPIVQVTVHSKQSGKSVNTFALLDTNNS